MKNIALTAYLPTLTAKTNGADITLRHSSGSEAILNVYTTDKNTDDPKLIVSIGQGKPLMMTLVDDSECTAPDPIIGQHNECTALLTFNHCTVQINLDIDSITVSTIEFIGTAKQEILETRTIKENELFRDSASGYAPINNAQYHVWLGGVIEMTSNKYDNYNPNRERLAELWHKGTSAPDAAEIVGRC
jgi:hypothetical protein